ncbi:MAG: deoxyribodipyrimidine photo-lyase [Alphaproteobacteria bacterium]|nr:deoxyribodipyrimidine photo-lyase [Alphaproteobacteria bacterium]
MTAAPTIIWFRQDLRVADQAALAAAAAEGPVVPVYVLDDEAPGSLRIGGAQRWWLHHSLAALDAELRGLGGRLILLRGRADTVLLDLAQAVGAHRIHALKHYEPWWTAQETALRNRMELRLHGGVALTPPSRVLSGTGGRYRIFTPFWRALQAQMPPPEPQPAPVRVNVPAGAPQGEALASWGLLPTKPDWAAGFSDWWTPGERGGWAALERFAEVAIRYDHDRNIPGVNGSSRLSPHLHFGELSPAQVWHTIADAVGKPAEPFLREVGWRDFALGLIEQFPDSATRPHRIQFEALRHTPGSDPAIEAWRRGMTGYPIVDAGMRELWATGWMHNRVRMIAASFLVKHLMGDWRDGFAWFWDTLLDADLGNNALGWQWIMGSGVDSSPFIRIFAPVGQGRKFDANGAYVRRWCPELAKLPDDVIHAPWEASAFELATAGVKLGQTYPEPVVAHEFARQRALAAFAEIKAG